MTEAVKDALAGAGIKMSVVIATPFYEVKAYSPYIPSLLNSIRVLDIMGIPWDYYELSGDSYVDRAKNSLVHRFLESDHTHLFMIDSDLLWDPMGFARIITAGILGAEIVGGTYPNKNKWDSFGALLRVDDGGHRMGKELSENVRLLDAEFIPGGFILYSRKAIERTRPNLETYRSWNDLDKEEEIILQCFKCNIEEDGGRIGEDVYFQKRYIEAGGIVWLEPRITFRHIGVHSWKGNFHQALLREEGRVEEAIADEKENEL